MEGATGMGTALNTGLTSSITGASIIEEFIDIIYEDYYEQKEKKDSSKFCWKINKRS